jgi:capsular polysaccharide transport system permease protein
MAEDRRNHPVRETALGMAAQQRVIQALLLREMQVRFGRDNIGILWIIIEPMMFAITVTLMHAASGFAQHGRGEDVYAFTVIGYCLFIIFRNIFNRAESAIHESLNLFYHRAVSPLDIVVAKSLVDMIGCTCAVVILLGFGIALDLCDWPARPLYLVAATVMIYWLTLGLSMLVAAYAHKHHFFGRLVHPFSYAMVPLSGAFVTMGFLPTWAREYMAWNPMMTIFEMARYGQFEVATDEYVYSTFAFAVCSALSYWGLLAMRRLRTQLHVA